MKDQKENAKNKPDQSDAELAGVTMPHLEQNFLSDLEKKNTKSAGLAQTKSKVKLTAEQKSDKLIDAFYEKKKQQAASESESNEASANT